MQTKNIAVFYHLYIPDIETSWIWWVEEQIGLLKTCGLADEATINMCITMPIGMTNTHNDYTFDEMVVQYIKNNYPFVNILSIRGTQEQPNLFEGHTLKHLYDYSLKNDGYVLYFHNKGMSNNFFKVFGIIGKDHEWRQYMNKYSVKKWKECVAKLDEGYEAVGPNYDKDFYPFAGNFWWARNDYIRQLSDPLKIDSYFNFKYVPIEEIRNAFEHWVGTKRPKIYYIDSKNSEESEKNKLYKLKKIEILKMQNKEFNNMNYKNIAVFYHLYISDTSESWIWWVDEQMGLLKSSGLSDAATINMCITVPVGLMNNKHSLTFDEMVVKYIKDNHPFVNIVDIRGTQEEPNIFEGQTIYQLYQHCLKNDGYVFYFHNKGMSSYSSHIPYCLKDWRHYMQYFNIEKWKECVAKLDEGYDCTGVSWIKREDLAGDVPTEGKRYIGNHFAGNFWWARNDYIRKLSDPLKIEDYVHVPSMVDFFKTYRYAFELWIGDENTKYYSFYQTKTHHYFEQFTREKYVLSDKEA